MSKKCDQLPDAAELRRRAESRLSEKKKRGAARPATEAKTRHLIHELQVHQIELEMQNEELVESRAAVEAVLRQYSDLYDFAPVGYFTFNRAGVIRQANLTGARLLGVARSQLIKRRFGLFLAPESRPAFDTLLANVFAHRTKESCELALRRDASTPLWAHVEAATEDGQECRAVVVDITARKEAEDELKHLSIHDALTGLYNRSFFQEAMARMERGRRFPISLLMADVNHLKETNDREGHAAGDALLQRVAQVLTDAFRAEDLISRIGGDEFAVLLPRTDATAAEDALRRVQQVLNHHNAAHGGTPIYVSFGVSTAETRAPLSDVLKEADASMYRAKRGHEASHKTSLPREDSSTRPIPPHTRAGKKRD